MAGRKPTPTHLRVIRGNPGKRPLPEHEPEPEPLTAAEMPAWLSADAQAHWPLVAEQLHDAGVLSKMDGPALGLYCESFARWRTANEQVTKFGVVVKTPLGYPIQSPYLAIANKAFDQMLKLLTEFGMTPSSRTKVQTIPGRKPGGKKRGSSLDEFQAAG